MNLAKRFVRPLAWGVDEASRLDIARQEKFGYGKNLRNLTATKTMTAIKAMIPVMVKNQSILERLCSTYSVTGYGFGTESTRL